MIFDDINAKIERNKAADRRALVEEMSPNLLWLADKHGLDVCNPGGATAWDMLEAVCKEIRPKYPDSE